MAVVDERDDAVPADPEHLLQHRLRITHRLDGLAEDAYVERAVRIVVQIGGQGDGVVIAGINGR